MIEIDGAAGEGRQTKLLRTSLALSMCTGQPFSMNRIPRRAQARLMRQHLGCVIAAAEISGAQVRGAELNSQSLSFAPGKRAWATTVSSGHGGQLRAVAATLWPALMMASGPSRLSLGGGTTRPRRRSISWRAATRPAGRLGAKVELNLLRMGFYPPAAARSRRGSGLPPISWSRST